MPVVAAHRGTYFSYLTCWAWAQHAWDAALAPLVGTLPAPWTSGGGATGATSSSGAARGGAGAESSSSPPAGQRSTAAARSLLARLLSLNAALTEQQVLSLLGELVAARRGAGTEDGASGGDSEQGAWAPPLPPDGLQRWLSA